MLNTILAVDDGFEQPERAAAQAEEGARQARGAQVQTLVRNGDAAAESPAAGADIIVAGRRGTGTGLLADGVLITDVARSKHPRVTVR